MSYTPSTPGRTLGSPARLPTSPQANSPSEAAAIAALTRNIGRLSLGASDSEPMYWERKDWQRLIDDEVSTLCFRVSLIHSE
jgi:hypothetical protein